jgi:hypothetical protein
MDMWENPELVINIENFEIMSVLFEKSLEKEES